MENQINHVQSPQLQSQQFQVEEDEISLMDLLLVIAKHNRFIIKLTAATAVLSVGAALLMPNIYTAKTVLMPPQQGSSSASALLGQLGGLAGAAGGALGIKNPNDLYVGMLKSRTVSDVLIRRFQLATVYESESADAVRNALAGATAVAAGKDGFITVEVSDKDPKLAAALANAYVEELDRLNHTLAVTEAAKRRLFFEKQLKQVKEDLVNAENALKQMQEKTGLIQPAAQGEAIIGSIAKLRAEIATKEVELAAMRTYATEQNPDYRQLREVVGGLRVQLSKLQRDSGGAEGDVLSSSGKVPEAGLEYLRKTRELKYQETLFEMLSKQFEIAKMDEAKDAVLIQVVDKAEEPEKKSKPKRAIIVILSTLAALFAGILLAFFREAAARARENPEQAERVNLLYRYLRQGR